MRIKIAKFRRIVAERGYTPTAFAEEVGMGTRTLAAILRGDEVSVATVEKVAKFEKEHPVRRDLVGLLEVAEPPAAEAVG